jgi:hypothetical protein
MNMTPSLSQPMPLKRFPYTASQVPVLVTKVARRTLRRYTVLQVHLCLRWRGTLHVHHGGLGLGGRALEQPGTAGHVLGAARGDAAGAGRRGRCAVHR